MDLIDPICLKCKHFGKPNGFGCRAFPGDIPYGYPPKNKHDKILDGQVGDYIFAPMDEEEKKSSYLIHHGY